MSTNKMWLIDCTNFELVGEYTSESGMLVRKIALEKEKVLFGVVREVNDVNKVLPTTKHQVILYKSLSGDPSARAPKANLFRHIYKLLNEDYVMPVKQTAAQMKAKKKGSKKTKAPKKVAAKTKTGSCALVHEVADAMYKKNKEVTRADILAACEKKGVNPSTAKTQYQKWKVENFG